MYSNSSIEKMNESDRDPLKGMDLPLHNKQPKQLPKFKTEDTSTNVSTKNKGNTKGVKKQSKNVYIENIYKNNKENKKNIKQINKEGSALTSMCNMNTKI